MVDRIRKVLVVAAAIVLSSATAARADAGASGSVTLDGTTWPVADAVAYVQDDNLKVAVSNRAFDRKQFAKDHRIDDLDIRFHAAGDVDTLTLAIGADGKLVGHDAQSSHGEVAGFDDRIATGFALKSRSASRVAGSLEFAGDDKLRAQITFDLPITTQIEPSGRKLGAGGGDIGKALLAHFAALASGKKDKVLAATVPERREEQRRAMDDPTMQEMLAFIAASTPTQVKVSGGVVDGETAVLEFTGLGNGKPLHGTAEATRVGGHWYFVNTRTTRD
jgi:hypothetical protein